MCLWPLKAGFVIRQRSVKTSQVWGLGGKVKELEVDQNPEQTAILVNTPLTGTRFFM